MSFRGCLLALAACSFLVVGVGCDNKTKAERDAFAQQNVRFEQDLKTARAENEALKAENAQLRAAATAPVVPPTTMAAPPDMGTGSDVVAADPTIKTGPRKGTRSSRGARTSYELSADVLFDSGKSTLKPSARKDLDKLSATLKSKHQGEHLTIEGHTDSTPFKKTSTMTNEKLGMNRAKAVLEYLAAHGIAKSSMTAVSMADKEPKSTTNPALNRRVTVIVGK